MPMLIQTTRSRLVAAAACLAAVLLLPTLVAAQTAAAPDVAERRGSIRSAPENIAAFRPEERERGMLDLSSVSVAEVMESLGEDAILWYQHVQTLSDPFLEGRRPGSRGADLTRDYIEFYFREYGLKPPFERDQDERASFRGEATEARSYQQPFEFRARASFGSVVVEDAFASIGDRALEADEHFVLLGNSASGSVTGPLTFVGYGIEDGPDGYDSFGPDCDLSGRVALLLRYEPIDDEGRSRWAAERFSSHASMASKMEAVADRGAAGIILVNPPGVRDGRIGLEPMRRSVRFGEQLDVPVMQLAPEVADDLLRMAGGRGLEAWRRRADEGRMRCETLRDEVQVSFGGALTRRTGNVVDAANVGGLLPGRGDLADEYLIIGAHQDHVGDGSLGGVRPANRGRLHPGADDNASGTAGVLVLARRLSELYASADAEANLRSVLFLTFDAEELGLHGSRHFALNPALPPERTVAVLNLDMIGRLRSDSLSVFGTGTGVGLEEILRPHFEASGLQIFVSPSGSGRSDDANFHRIGVPAVHFFTGMHAEYTTPEDQGFTVNPTGAARIIDLVQSIALDLATRPEPVTYRDPPSSPGQDRGYARVRLGVRPGMAEREGGGLLVEEVFEGTSADDGGLRGGDVIVAWDDSAIDGARDLFEALQKHTPGDVVTIRVLRDGRSIDLKVTLKGG